jgi:hypothetical protein
MAGHGVLVATPVIAAIGVAILAALRVFVSFMRPTERNNIVRTYAWRTVFRRAHSRAPLHNALFCVSPDRVSIAQLEVKNGTYVSIYSCGFRTYAVEGENMADAPLRVPTMGRFCVSPMDLGLTQRREKSCGRTAVPQGGSALRPYKRQCFA